MAESNTPNSWKDKLRNTRVGNAFFSALDSFFVTRVGNILLYAIPYLILAFPFYRACGILKAAWLQYTTYNDTIGALVSIGVGLPLVVFCIFGAYGLRYQDDERMMWIANILSRVVIWGPMVFVPPWLVYMAWKIGDEDDGTPRMIFGSIAAFAFAIWIWEGWLAVGRRRKATMERSEVEDREKRVIVDEKMVEKGNGL